MTEATTTTDLSRPTIGELGTYAGRALTWGAAVLLAVYLGLSGGGYDIVVRSELGLVVWWFVLLGVLVGVVPRARIPAVGLIAVGLLAGFLIWTWIGLSWTNSHELTLDDVCLLSTYLGVLVLGLCALTLGNARTLINGLACGIAAVSAVAIMSKLAPSLFPANAASSFYNTARLSYPFNYADGVGEYAALGLPLVLYMATSGRTLTGRAVATGALMPVLLCLAMTVSRGGILAAFIGVIAFFALVPDRIPRLPTLIIAAGGIAVLMVGLLHRAALRDSTGVAPASERHSMFALICVVVVGTVLVQAVVLLVMRRASRPRWLRVSRRGAQLFTGAVVAAVIAVVIVGFASGTVSHGWHDFKLWQPQRHANQYLRLVSLAGSHRYQYWQVAWKAFESSPFHGIGPGTFQFYWEQHTTHAEYIQNAHSLWFETLAETGIVGWLLIAGFFGLSIIGGIVRCLRVAAEHRAAIATATAGVIAFCAAASFDWIWQIGVVPMVAMLLVAVTVMQECGAVVQAAASGPRASYTARRRLGPRVALGLGSVLALILIAIPLASTVEVRASQAAAVNGQLSAARGQLSAARAQLAKALADANTAQSIEPGAATPDLQRALVLEQADDISDASAAIRAALAREPTDYKLWLVADPIALEADHPRQALADWRKARALYPTSVVFGG